MVNENSLEEVS